MQFIRLSWARNRLGARSAVFDKSRPLAFMHIPKTSGVAVTHGLAEALAPAVTVGGFDHSLLSANQDFDSMDDTVRRHIYPSPTSMPKRADLIAGHFAISTLIKAYPNAQYMTILREPVSRLLSHWLYWRQMSDEALAPWGETRYVVKLARGSLEDFLSEAPLAVATDNLMLRMLLWPHPLIKKDEFIEPARDRQLLREATIRLQMFDFVDYVENSALLDRLQTWLGRPFNYHRLNETDSMPRERRSSLHQELTLRAYELLCNRSRLDNCLWHRIAAQSLSSSNIGRLRDRTILATVSRHSVLMAPELAEPER